MGRFELLPEARRDLKGISKATRERWGGKQRDKYIAQLNARFQKLAENPKTGRPRDEIEAGLRSAKQGRHLIFYEERVTGETTEIVIIRVLHESMDVAQALAPGPGTDVR